MKIYKLGDRIDIKYKLDNLELKDKATITYYHPKGFIFTCGHCFSKNAILDIGDLIYSSGFDTKDEGKEIAIIKIKEKYKCMFKPIILSCLNENISYYGSKAIMVHEDNFYFGKVIKKIDKILLEGNYKINDKESYYHNITKLDPPYYLVKHSLIDIKHGLSGSPWIIYDKEFKLLGAHIGRTKINENTFISYVKPLNIS